MVQEAMRLLNADKISDFGKLLHENWQIKRRLSDMITTSHIDAIYETARRAGAIGGKLLGAGGGGFVLIFAPPAAQKKIKGKLKKLLLVPFKFENLGTQIIFYQPNGEYERP
jgi:D-glycero-alpha-D-manno-heptose-7-phosphate kinase